MGTLAIAWALEKAKHFILSPSSLRRGLYSVATVNSGQPSTKCFAFSNAQAMASVSSSTGLYRLSAPVRNLLPQNTVTHPCGQHTGVISGQSHLFWSSTNPRKELDLCYSRKDVTVPILHQCAVHRDG